LTTQLPQWPFFFGRDKSRTIKDFLNIPRGKSLWSDVVHSSRYVRGWVGYALVATPIFMDPETKMVPLQDPPYYPKGKEEKLERVGVFWQGFPLKWVSDYLKGLEVENGYALIYIIESNTGYAIATSRNKTTLYVPGILGPRLQFAVESEDQDIRDVSQGLLLAAGVDSFADFPPNQEMTEPLRDDYIHVVARRTSRKLNPLAVDWVVVVAVNSSVAMGDLNKSTPTVYAFNFGIVIVFRVLQFLLFPLLMILFLDWRCKCCLAAQSKRKAVTLVPASSTEKKTITSSKVAVAIAVEKEDEKPSNKQEDTFHKI